MLEKPNLSDAQIQTCLNASFGLTIQNLEFLPIGYDAYAWVYRIDAINQQYFLKVRKGTVYPAALTVPHYLQQQGIENIVAPLESFDGKLCVPIDDFSLIVYPWIDSDSSSAWDMTLTQQQWQAWGEVMRRIHQTPIADKIMSRMKKEAFTCQWDAMFHKVDRLVQSSQFADPIKQEAAALWKQKQDTINHAYRRMVELGTQLQAQEHQYVICHADIHKANIMIDRQDVIRIVDWDGVILAPIERDLMFFVDNGYETHKPEWFLQGYGDVTINQTAIAFYRYEWVVQEFGDFGERIFFNDELGELSKQDSLNGFKQLFDVADVIDLAMQADMKL